MIHDNIANNCMWDDLAECTGLYVVPCGMSMLNQWNVPQGYVVFYGGLKALLDLLGPYSVYRLIYMSCLMSSWDVNPTIRYKLCVLHMLLLCVFYLVAGAFLALLGKNVRR